MARGAPAAVPRRRVGSRVWGWALGLGVRRSEGVGFGVRVAFSFGCLVCERVLLIVGRGGTNVRGLLVMLSRWMIDEIRK